MGKLYKLTNQEGYSGLGLYSVLTHWAEGTKHSISPELRDKNASLCSKHFIHVYENPLVAVFMNPAHINFKNPILWEATGWVSKREGHLKCGCFSLTTHRKITLPVITLEQRVRAAIYCSLEVCKNKQYKQWADKWLSGENRTRNVVYITSAAAAAAYADAAADAAATATYTSAAAAIHATSKHLDLISILKRSIKEEKA